MVIAAKPQPVVAPSGQVDCLSQMITLGQQQELPWMDTINEKLATLEQRMGKSVREHLGFGLVSASAIKVNDNDIGELNIDNKLHGKGIYIYSNGYIRIQYFNNGHDAIGKYIQIWDDGRFFLGEIYMKDGE